MGNIKSIQKDCIKGKIGMLEAISLIDTQIGGITGVDFKTGLNFKLKNHNGIYALPYEGFSKKEMQKVQDMAVMSYKKAQDNGSQFPGEVHISRQASTCHHMDGIYDIMNKYMH